jgi:hypothetical protein
MIGNGRGDLEPIYQTFINSMIDPNTPNIARMYDYYLGGKDNFPCDREAAREVIARVPLASEIAQHNRYFLSRCVRYLVGQCGIQQIIDVGTGLPTQGSVYEVAQAIVPDVRVVYVDNDPLVLAYARSLRVPNDNVAVLNADAREPDAILRSSDVRELIDFSEPVAVLFIALLHFITDDEDPRSIVGTFRAAIPSGSCIAISHVEKTRQTQEGAKIYGRANAPVVPRSRDEIKGLFDGLQLADPGVVCISEWRPDFDGFDRPNQTLPFLGGVGRKP